MSYHHKTLILPDSKETMSEKEDMEICRNTQAIPSGLINPNNKVSNI
jgi:hypothetical protein